MLETLKYWAIFLQNEFYVFIKICHFIIKIVYNFYWVYEVDAGGLAL